MEIVTIIGWLGSVALILGYAPQAIYTIRTRDTDGISLYGFVMMAIGGILFMMQGFLMGNVPLWVTNAITTISSIVVFTIKMYNDHFRRLRHSHAE